MTDEQIIEMAKQAGCLEKYQVFYFTNDELKTFAKLVATKAVDDYLDQEREAELQARGEA